MTLSLTTLVVVSANFLTAVIAAALLMLVLWQAPRHRMNQLFAFVMVMLGGYSISNAFNRFIDDLQHGPQARLYTSRCRFSAFLSYRCFSSRRNLADRVRPPCAGCVSPGIIMILFSVPAIWTDNLRTNIRPLEDGNYTADVTPFGYFTIGMIMIYMIASAVVLYRMKGERGHSLWPAPLFVIANVDLFHCDLAAGPDPAGGVVSGRARR